MSQCNCILRENWKPSQSPIYFKQTIQFYLWKAPRRRQCNCDNSWVHAYEMHSPFQEIPIKKEDKKTQTKWQTFICSKTFMISNTHNARQTQPGVPTVASLEQYYIRWQAGWLVVRSPRDTTHYFSPKHQTERSQVPGGGEAEFLCDKLPGVVNTSARKATVWPRHPESTSSVLGSSL